MVLNCVYCTSAEYITCLCDLPEELDKPLHNIIILKLRNAYKYSGARRGILDLTCWVMDAAGGPSSCPDPQEKASLSLVWEQNVNEFFWNGRGISGRF